MCDLNGLAFALQLSWHVPKANHVHPPRPHPFHPKPPHHAQPRDVEEWLLATAAHKRLNVVAAHVVSSKTGQGLSKAAASLRTERLGRDVYVMGAANVGKSAFVRAFVKCVLFDVGGLVFAGAEASVSHQQNMFQNLDYMVCI